MPAIVSDHEYLNLWNKWWNKFWHRNYMAIFLILKWKHMNARVQSFPFPSTFHNASIIKIVVRCNSLLKRLGAEKWLMRQDKVPSPACCLQSLTRVGVVLISPHQSTSRTRTTIHLLFKTYLYAKKPKINVMLVLGQSI